MAHKGISLQSIMKIADQLHEIRKADVQPGDILLITTCNSLYRIIVVSKERYCVTGGWFDRKGLAPFITTVTGCTWGGSIIKTDSIAACGLSIEFGNCVTTSTVKNIIVFKKWLLN